jgi:hypothetical protein
MISSEQDEPMQARDATGNFIAYLYRKSVLETFDYSKII